MSLSTSGGSASRAVALDRAAVVARIVEDRDSAMAKLGVVACKVARAEPSFGQSSKRATQERRRPLSTFCVTDVFLIYNQNQNTVEMSH